MDLNISPGAVFHSGFESRSNIGPKSIQNPILINFLHMPHGGWCTPVNATRSFPYSLFLSSNLDTSSLLHPHPAAVPTFMGTSLRVGPTLVWGISWPAVALLTVGVPYPPAWCSSVSRVLSTPWRDPWGKRIRW